MVIYMKNFFLETVRNRRTGALLPRFVRMTLFFEATSTEKWETKHELG